MIERIEKKLEQIKKIEKKLSKYEAKLTDEQKELAIKLNWKQVSEYCGRNYELNCSMDDYRRVYSELKVAKEQLVKLQKQAEVKKAKEDSLNNMPEALKKFAEEMEMIWNQYDKEERDFLKRKYKEFHELYPKNSIQGYKDFIKEYKYSGYEKMHRTDEEIETTNKKAVDSLILNLFNRVVEKTGKIINAEGLKVTRGNGGYAVINGIVIGEKDKAVVESIPAGGYNIQRYHIRTIVK